MIIHDFDIAGITVGEAEAEPPAVVDPDAVPADVVASQGFERIAWWNAQKGQGRSDVQLRKLASVCPLDALEPTYAKTFGKSFGLPAARVPDHGATYRFSICELQDNPSLFDRRATGADGR